MRRIPNQTEVEVEIGSAKNRYRITSFVAGDDKHWPHYRVTNVRTGKRGTLRADIADRQNPDLVADLN